MKQGDGFSLDFSQAFIWLSLTGLALSQCILETEDIW